MGRAVIVPVLLLVTSAIAARPLGVPRSFTVPVLGVDGIDHRVQGPVDVEALLEEDARRTERPAPFRVAKPIALDASVRDSGTWETLSDGAAIWRLRVSSPGAAFLSLKFSEFELPPGAEVYFVSVAHDYEDGPYTARHNKPTRRFGSPMIPGDSAIVELYLPPGGGDVALRIESVSHGYRDVMGMGVYPPRSGAPAETPGAREPEGGPFTCQRDINCPEGAAYQDVKRSVAEGYDGSFICSGTVLNNTRQDNQYLYLTAEHCEWWLDPSAMTYYWKYERPGCATGTAPVNFFSTGSTDLYHSAAADLDLLRLDGTDLDTTFDIYFTGWSRKTTPPTSGTIISFPDDKPKKIAIENDPLIDCAPAGCFDGFGANFWRVEGWDVGVTEGGSSGGGLLDQDQLLVGVLTGGVGTTCNDFEWDEFAKIHTSWTQLRPFLDPDNTGVIELAGRNHDVGPAPPPMADGIAGSPMRLTKAGGSTIAVTYDAVTCSDDHAVMLWGAIGNWTGYQGDVGVGCNLGDTGAGSFGFAGTNAWFNLIWVGAAESAGPGGSSSAGPRTWPASGLCGVTSDAPSGSVCGGPVP